jgi:phosphohistidine phosphatase SixA
MEYVKPAQDMNRTLKEISNGAKQMLKVAEKLKDNNDIDNFLQSKAVTADYRDTTSVENQGTGEENGQTSRPCLTETN